MFDIGGPELMLILFIFLLLFGAKKMPELAKGLGKSIREFKKAANSVENEVRRAMEETPASAALKMPEAVPQVKIQNEPPLPPSAD